VKWICLCTKFVDWLDSSPRLFGESELLQSHGRRAQPAYSCKSPEANLEFSIFIFHANLPRQWGGDSSVVVSPFKSSVIDRDARLPRETSINVQGGAGPFALYNMERFWTGKCSVQFAYLKSGGLKQKTITWGRRGREKVKKHWSNSSDWVFGPQPLSESS